MKPSTPVLAAILRVPLCFGKLCMLVHLRSNQVGGISYLFFICSPIAINCRFWRMLCNDIISYHTLKAWMRYILYRYCARSRRFAWTLPRLALLDPDCCVIQYTNFKYQCCIQKRQRKFNYQRTCLAVLICPWLVRLLGRFWWSDRPVPAIIWRTDSENDSRGCIMGSVKPKQFHLLFYYLKRKIKSF